MNFIQNGEFITHFINIFSRKAFEFVTWFIGCTVGYLVNRSFSPRYNLFVKTPTLRTCRCT